MSFRVGKRVYQQSLRTLSSLSLILHLTVVRASDNSPKYRHGIRTRVTWAMNRHLLLSYGCQNKSVAFTKQAYNSFIVKICYTAVKVTKFNVIKV